MKKLLKLLLYSIGSLLGLVVVIILIAILWISVAGNHSAKKYMEMAGAETPTLTIDGFGFRDLNKNGKLDVYEDSRQPIEARVNNLLSLMNLEEKAGEMFIPPVSMNKDGSISEKPS